MFKYLGCVLAGKLRPAGGFTEWTALGSNGHPRVITHLNILDVDQQHITAFSALNVNRSADRVGQGRMTVEAGSVGRDGLVARVT